MKITLMCPTLYDTMDCRPPGSSVHGILQARILEWVAIPFFRGNMPHHQEHSPTPFSLPTVGAQCAFIHRGQMFNSSSREMSADIWEGDVSCSLYSCPSSPFID